MELYDRKMVTNTNLKDTDSSLNYYVIKMVQNLKNFKLENLQKNSHSRGMKFQPKTNNNREAVVVCARHVVKRPSKRCALVHCLDISICTDPNFQSYFFAFISLL